MEYKRSPLRIEISRSANKGPVRVINTAAYVYRRSASFTPNNLNRPRYWAPCGEYFVRYIGVKFPVTFHENGFVMKVSVADYMQLLFMHKEKIDNGQTRKSSAA